MKRLFLAINISPDNKFNELFQNLQKELVNEKIRWSDPNNLHLTIKFFGETEDAKINKINFNIDNSISMKNTFSFEISNLGVFGSSYQPKVVWLGIKKNYALIDLADTILNGLKIIGFERDRQNFVPHLTIGRINYLTDKQRFNQIINKYNISEIQTVDVNEIFLFESILRKDGPIYKTISNYKLMN